MKKKILVIMTGGTISMNKYKTNNLVDISSDNSYLLDELKTKISGIEIEYTVQSMIPSPHMTLNDMFNLTKLIDKSVKRDDIFGVVITHGTDTLEETAFMTNLYLTTKKPVIFTGSMRSYSEISYDGIRNLYSSILVASDEESINKGTLVVLNDVINSAAEVTKTHTLALDTFKSLDFGPLGIIDNDQVIYYRSITHNSLNLRPSTFTDNIEIIKISAGVSSLLLNFVISQNVNGIILEGLGRGNIPPNLVDDVVRAIEKNIPVIMTSRVPMGRVLGTYGYAGGGGQLEKLGVIFAPNLNGQKARILLSLALGTTTNLKEINKYFNVK